MSRFIAVTLCLPPMVRRSLAEPDHARTAGRKRLTPANRPRRWRCRRFRRYARHLVATGVVPCREQDTLRRARRDKRQAKQPAPRRGNSSARRCTTFARASTARHRQSGDRDRPVQSTSRRGGPRAAEIRSLRVPGDPRAGGARLCGRPWGTQATTRNGQALARFGECVEARQPVGGESHGPVEAGEKAAQARSPAARSAAARKAAHTRTAMHGRPG